MTVYQEKSTKIWFYDFYRQNLRFKARCIMPDGTRAISKKQAKACENVRRAALEKGETKVEVPAGRYTFAEALAARVKVAKRKKHWRDVKIALNEIGNFFGPDAPIEDVARRWREYEDFSSAQTVKIWMGGPKHAAKGEAASGDRAGYWHDTGKLRSSGRTNRYLDQLSAVLRLAHETEGPDGRFLLDRMPTIKRQKEPKRKPRPVPLAVALKIESDPRTPDYLRDAAAMVRLFGFRLDEVFGTTRNEIDFDGRCYRLPAEKTKAGRDEVMPANAEAMRLLKRLDEAARKREPDNDAAPLIVYQPRGKDAKGRPFKPRPIANPRRAWATIQKRLGIKSGFRFHDLRATFITQTARVAKSAVVQTLARHTDARTTARYIEVADEDLRKAVEAMAGRRRD
jgi:integrase